MKINGEYIEDGEEERYIARNRKYFLTPFEDRAEYLGMLREKARHRLREPNGHLSRVTHEALEHYRVNTDDEVKLAIGDDLDSFRDFQQKVTHRIVEEFKCGRLVVLRCPACNRVTFT